jgi:hypothetical protein
VIRAGGPKPRNTIAVDFSRTRGFSLFDPTRDSPRAAASRRVRHEKSDGEIVHVLGVFTRRSFACVRFQPGKRAYYARGSRTVSAVSKKISKAPPSPAAHLAARMEYDNAPYPMMATADAPSNAP